MVTKATMQLVETQQWLEPVADQLQPAVTNALAAGGSVGPKSPTPYMGHGLDTRSIRC
jgi:hypothetical protein